MLPALALMAFLHDPGATPASAPTRAPVRSLHLPEPARTAGGPAEIRLRPDGAAYAVSPGVQLEGRLEGDLMEPLTDPGRTVLRVTLRAPLRAQNGWTVLLPIGTQLVGQVHLLRGDYRFVDFQSLILPDGRALPAPEGSFRLGPGSSLALQSGGSVALTVARPLRVEAFGR
ncbi:MAG TPA: hypothetical protein VGJ89_03060 [Geothrix sp.]